MFYIKHICYRQDIFTIFICFVGYATLQLHVCVIQIKHNQVLKTLSPFTTAKFIGANQPNKIISAERTAILMA